MKISDIQNIQQDKCVRFSEFATAKLPMPGIKKHLEQVLNKEIMVVDFRVTESKHRQNSKCLQIQFVMDNEICVVFTGSAVLLDQIQFSQDKMPFLTTITKIDKYYTLS